MANLILHTDLDCKVYIDTEYHGIAKANTDYVINLSDGAYWVECISIEDANLSQDFDFIANDPSENIHKEIAMLYSLRLRQLKAKYDSVGDFIYGYARVENKGKLVGYIDTTYQFKYDDVAVLYDGILSVKRDNHYGVINNSKEIIPIKYDSISLLGDKMLRLGLNGRFCLANIEGVKLTPLKYHKIEYAMNDIYAIYFDKWVFVDSNIVEVDSPNNVILYSTNNDTPIDVERYDITYNSITYNSAFGQVPVAHNYHNGDGLLVFENNVTFIGEETFEHCYSLISATIPNSVISIGDSAFYYCDSLANITIPDSVTSIGAGVFSCCSSLTSIIIPDSVISIGDNAFFGCESLTAFYGKFASDDNRCLIVNGVLNSFAPAGLTQYVIPDIVITIGESAFQGCSNLTSIIIPDSVTSIEGYAFYGCSHLTEVIIPDSVTSIEDHTFSDCSSLTTVTIPDSVTSIGAGAFSSCSSITSIIIPDSVTSIGAGVFSRCSSITSIIIPDSVTSIENFAFSHCSSLTSITTPNSVTVIGNSAFLHCSSLTSITIPNSVTVIGNSAFLGCNNLTNMTIPDSVTTIGMVAFSDCKRLANFYGKFASNDNRCLIIDGVLNSFVPANLTQYSIPKNVTTIGRSAFHNCGNLTSIIIPDSVTSIEGYAFSHCSSLTSITIPDSVTSIGEHAFYGCSRLTDITIPNSVTSIGRSAFALCESLPIINNIRYADCYAVYVSDSTLTTYAFKKGVRFIGSTAFNYCHSLVEISIPNSVISIGNSTFSHCSSLISITIPDSVISIGEYAFSEHLEEIHCKSVIPPKIMAQRIKKECTIYVPAESVDIYKSAEGWKEYADQIMAQIE